MVWPIHSVVWILTVTSVDGVMMVMIMLTRTWPLLRFHRNHWTTFWCEAQRISMIEKVCVFQWMWMIQWKRLCCAWKSKATNGSLTLTKSEMMVIWFECLLRYRKPRLPLCALTYVHLCVIIGVWHWCVLRS